MLLSVWRPKAVKRLPRGQAARSRTPHHSARPRQAPRTTPWKSGRSAGRRGRAGIAKQRQYERDTLYVPAQAASDG